MQTYTGTDTGLILLLACTAMKQHQILISALLFLVRCCKINSLFPPVDPPAPMILETRILHDHWRRLVRQRVRMSVNTTVDFELVGQRDPDQAVLVFVWHRQNQTVTCVREYMPSKGGFGYGLAAGMADAEDNGDSLKAGRRELQEECFLGGGEWFMLTPSEGVVMDKYCTTRLAVYLVVDPHSAMNDSDHHHRDEAEEGMQSVNVPIETFLEVCLPNMTIVGAWASMLALRKIAQLN